MYHANHLSFFENSAISLSDKVIFLDIDGTLLPDSEDLIALAVKKAVQHLMKNNRMFLCTNSRNNRRNAEIEKQLGLKIINPHHKKPSRNILRSIGMEELTNAVVIGDKFLTDAWFAKNIGADFFMMRRKLSGRETFRIKLYNLIDDFAYNLHRYLKKNLLIFSRPHD